jgi:hypothetical protein
MDNQKTKTIFFSKEENEKKENLKKEKTKRVITEAWKIDEEDLFVENQRKYIENLYKIYCLNLEDDPKENSKEQLILQQLNQKITGYKTQDIQKKIFDKELFVDTRTTVNLLNESELKCFYCRQNVKILYEYVREPLQWSLDRLNNQYGHNKNNIVIACLSCNLKRKTMYHERYVFTKQMYIVKTAPKAPL